MGNHILKIEITVELVEGGLQTGIECEYMNKFDGGDDIYRDALIPVLDRVAPVAVDFLLEKARSNKEARH